jgi:hypothetical protein
MLLRTYYGTQAAMFQEAVRLPWSRLTLPETAGQRKNEEKGAGARMPELRPEVEKKR